jgi:hypothetical protein
MSATETRRNRRLMKVLLGDPTGISYGDLARRFRISRARVGQIVRQEMGPDYSKPRTKERHYCAIDDCGVVYFHEYGYVGARCPAHRRPWPFRKADPETVQAGS